MVYMPFLGCSLHHNEQGMHIMLAYHENMINQPKKAGAPSQGVLAGLRIRDRASVTGQPQETGRSRTRDSSDFAAEQEVQAVQKTSTPEASYAASSYRTKTNRFGLTPLTARCTDG